jgi:hypothetical protein
LFGEERINAEMKAFELYGQRPSIFQITSNPDQLIIGTTIAHNYDYQQS